MDLEKLKIHYRKAFEQESKWSAEATSAAEETRRYRDLINFSNRVLASCGSDKLFRGEVLKNLGYLYDVTDDSKRAEKSLKEAISIFKRVKDGKVKAWLAESYCLLGDTYRDYGDFKKSLQLYKQAIEAAGRQEQTRKFKAKSYWGIGDIFRSTGKYKEALKFLDKAESDFKKVESKEGIGDVLWARGYVYICLTDYGKAELCFNEILKMWEMKELDESYRGVALGSLGDVCRLSGRFENAIEFYTKAEESMELREDDMERAWILSVMFDAYLNLGNLKDARSVTIRAESLARRMNDKYSLLFALLSWGELERFERNFAAAARRYNECLKVARSIGCTLEIGHSYLGLALIAHQNGENPAPLFTKAQTTYRKIDSEWGLKECGLRREAILKSDEKAILKPLNFP